MVNKKHPPPKKHGSVWFCPEPRCPWKSTVRNSYPRHRNEQHSQSFKYICEECGSQHARDENLSRHKLICQGRVANRKKRGRKTNLSTPEEYREAFPVDPEERVQILEETVRKLKGTVRVLEERVGVLGGEKEELLLEKQQLVELVADLRKDLEDREEVVRMEPDEAEMAGDVELNVEEDFEIDEEVEEQVDRSIPSPVSTVRKSGRVTSLNLQKRSQEEVMRRLSQEFDNGLTVKEVEGKGKAVFTARDFMKGEYVAEYTGKMLSKREAKEVEASYRLDPAIGSYMYEFQVGGRWFCIDATRDDGRVGRLINHSKGSPNILARIVIVDQTPRMYFKALEDIAAGKELSYNYADEDKLTVANNLWLGQ